MTLLGRTSARLPFWRTDPKVEFRVERYRERFTDRTPGYLPAERVREMQRLVRVTRTWLGSSRKVIDSEEIPEHVMITLGCCGDTGAWRSKFKDYIN